MLLGALAMCGIVCAVVLFFGAHASVLNAPSGTFPLPSASTTNITMNSTTTSPVAISYHEEDDNEELLSTEMQHVHNHADGEDGSMDGTHVSLKNANQDA